MSFKEHIAAMIGCMMCLISRARNYLSLDNSKILSDTYVLFNVYFPTQDHKHGQNKFAANNKEELAQNENIILGGDFNF